LAVLLCAHRRQRCVGRDEETGLEIETRNRRRKAYALAPPEIEKFRQPIGYFKTYGEQYAIDPYMLAAQAYQESSFDQSLRMSSGAVGKRSRERPGESCARQAKNCLKGGTQTAFNQQPTSATR
jgi:hypothetical protein